MIGCQSYCNTTAERYGFLWLKHRSIKPPDRYHFDSMQEVISERIVKGSVGLDLGCGCGWDTFIMAKRNPSVRIVGMDVSDGIYITSELTRNLKNVIIVKGSASNICLKSDTCDFVYSFGVLHHMSDYKRGLLEIFRVLKEDSPSFLYLYEDHSEDFLKRIILKIIACIRRITVRIPPRVLYVFSYMISPFVFLLFSCPAKVFKRYKSTYKFYEKMPFNFGSSLFSLWGDMYDRFSTPVELRFSREMIQDLLSECRFTNIRIVRLKATAGWAIQAYKHKQQD